MLIFLEDIIKIYFIKKLLFSRRNLIRLLDYMIGVFEVFKRFFLSNF